MNTKTKMHEELGIGGAAIMGNFDFSLPGPNGATLRITGYVYEGEELADLHKRMDVCREALTRQQTVLEKPLLEERLVGLLAQKEHVAKAYLDLLEKNKTRPLPASEAQHLKNYPLQIKQIDDEIAKGSTKLAAIEAA